VALLVRPRPVASRSIVTLSLRARTARGIVTTRSVITRAVVASRTVVMLGRGARASFLLTALFFLHLFHLVGGDEASSQQLRFQIEHASSCRNARG
jgi:hypothetical protein